MASVEQTSAVRDAMQPTGPVSILLVDDRPEQLLALESVLDELTEKLVRANSGKEALRYLLHHECAVILLDVNMPGMDGFETASLIRQRKNSEHTPIIFITAYSDTETHVSRGYSLGAVDYIHAPIVPEVLKTKVAVFVDQFKKTQQVKQLLVHEQKRAAQLRELAAASLAINSQLSMDKLLQTVADQSREIIGAHQSIISVAEEQNWSKASQASSLSHKYATWPRRDKRTKPSRIYETAIQLRQPMRMSYAQLSAHAAWPSLAEDVNNHPPLRGWLSAPLTGRDGRIMGFILLSDKYDGEFTEDDETILVQLSQMVSIAIENTLYSEAREANRLKDEFLATLSHELRTPLSAILGWTQVLRKGTLDPAASDKALEVIERNVQVQAKLIEDLLDVSRIVSGKLKLNARPIQLVPVIEAAVDSVRPAAEAKQIQIQVILDPSHDPLIADPDRIQQIIWNLLSNAVKFTPRAGRVRIWLERTESHARITVSDTGEGIRPEFLPYIFQRFRQADSSTRRSHAGLGIGLAVVRHLVELHGGSVSAKSDGESQGATFTVELPIAPPHTDAGKLDRELPRAPALAAFPVGPAIHGLRVLLVDDDPDTRDMLRTMLSQHGAEVTAVSSTREVLEQLDRFTPDILVSDIGMAGEDGYDLIGQVRARAPEQGGSIPALALTAYVRSQDRRRALAAGFQMHLPKPVEATQFVHTVAAVAKQNMPANATTLKPSRVL